MRVIGLDIGTTSICASVTESDTGITLEAINENNDSFIKTEEAWQKRQNPKIILDIAFKLVKKLSKKYAPISAIGVTGQMHGIVYLSKDGDAVSPLYTWQDGSGERIYKNGNTYAQELSELTGYNLSTGFGAVTYFYHQLNNEVPQNATVFCTIHDYVAMKLAKGTTPIIHSTNAASLGLFSLKDGEFDLAAIAKAGLNYKLFPKVGRDYEKIGQTEGNVPVYIAIGDNQAAFIGSVNDMQNSILVNIGTGSQISFVSNKLESNSELELRPCVENEYLMVGSSLCGGRAYALFEQFCRKIVIEAGIECERAYSLLDKFTENYDTLEDTLFVNTQFCGTRSNPQKRGSISNIGIYNFTPEHFAVGIYSGMSEELYGFYATNKNLKHTKLIGSGNGIRKGKALKGILEKRFKMPLYVPSHTEEASYGASLFAMVGVGIFKSIRDAQKIIKYN